MRCTKSNEWYNKHMHMGGQHKQGFTIVELLIVIVVIGILAAITIVAFNGIQERSKNTQTVNAVAAYVKLIKLYKVDEGTHPDIHSVCLGTGYPGGECRAGWGESSTFNETMLGNYMKGTPPAPDYTEMYYSAGLPSVQGAWYDYQSGSYNPTGGGIGVMLLGDDDCPSISGTSYVSRTATEDGKGQLCRYAIN